MQELDEIDGLAPTTSATGVTTATATVTTAGQVDAVLPLASVTKPLAAWATLVAVDQGRVDLADDVDGDGRTLRHLLAHASGLGTEAAGPHTSPERRRAYSNHAFDLIGEHVAAAVGRPFATWLHAQVLLPLGMHATSLDGSPARDGTGTVTDLLAFARELLAPTLVDEDLRDEAVTPQWPDLDGVLPGYGRQTPNPWGLGLELRGDKDPHWTDAGFPATTFGHFGQSGSFLWVSPEDGCAAAFLGDEPFGAWAVEAWPGLTALQRRLGTEAAA